MNKFVFETERLKAVKAKPDEEDIDFFFCLYTNPEVMKFVGFPGGLRITKREIKEKILFQEASEFDQALIVITKDGTKIGECKLGTPDENGVSKTDIKLLPQFWNKGYGKEIKAALVKYLFENTGCRGIKATPKKKNIASIKMQESVGAKKISEGKYVFPENMKTYTIDVEYYEYILYKEDWWKRKTF